MLSRDNERSEEMNARGSHGVNVEYSLLYWRQLWAAFNVLYSNFGE